MPTEYSQWSSGDKHSGNSPWHTSLTRYICIGIIKQGDSRANDAEVELQKLVLNYSLVYGCMPGTGVKADTKMCKDVSEALLKGIGADMYTQFPHFMESIKGDDVNFEINSSATL